MAKDKPKEETPKERPKEEELSCSEQKDKKDQKDKKAEDQKAKKDSEEEAKHGSQENHQEKQQEMAKYFNEKILKPGVLRELAISPLLQHDECKWELDNSSWNTAVFRALAF